MLYPTAVKALGGVFNFGPSRGGLIERGHIEEGGLFTKSSDKDTFSRFSVLSSHILRNEHTILRFKYINSTPFLSETISKLTCKVVSRSEWKYLVNSRTSNKLGGGLNSEWDLFKILTKRRGVY